MNVTNISTTKLINSQAIAGNPSTPDVVAAQILTDNAVVATGTLATSIPLPKGATVTGVYLSTTGTGTIWVGTPAFYVSITTNGSKPSPANFISALNSTITGFGQCQEFAKSTWITYQNATNVAAASVLYLYVVSGTFAIPTTAQVTLNVQYYIKP